MAVDKSKLIPLPKKLFSLTEKATVAPAVPVPAPSAISPVAFSSTVIFMILDLKFLNRVCFHSKSHLWCL